MKTLVSVIIPTYNEEKYILGSLNTLILQSYNPIEIIIIDDGSTDSTLKIIQDFSKKDKKIKILKQQHQGPGKARNLGAEKSKGKILIFVDADMEFDKDYIKNLVQPILEGKTFGTIHTTEHILNKGNIWARFWGPRQVVDKDGNGVIFRAIAKEAFFKYGPFNSDLGYADDQTIYKNSGIKSRGVDATCYHKNPSSLLEVYKQSKWIGSSYSFKILDIPILNLLVIPSYIILVPFYVIYLIIKKIFENKSREHIAYFIFLITKYAGSFVGILQRIFLKRKLK